MPASIKRLRLSLGTLVAIEAIADSEPAALTAIEAAFAAITEVGQLMHPASAGSDLARINNTPPNTPLTVHPSVLELLEFARRLNELTEGVFDPCLPERRGRLQDVETAVGSLTCRRPVALDFGGFAKGHAVDRAVDALKSGGCTAGLVNAGGDLRVFGPAASQIMVRSALGPPTQVQLVDTALAVSDVDSQSRPPEHRGYYVRGYLAGEQRRHPGAEGAPRLVNRRAAVVAREARVADALAKCVLLCPARTASKALAAFGATRLAAP